MKREKPSPDWPYHDIVNLPHPPLKHPRMDSRKRAAQFAPFAALTGYDAAIEETARLTDARMERDEAELEELNRRITKAAAEKREIRIVYFLPDEKKAGGAYVEVLGRIKKANLGQLLLEDGRQIPIEDVYDILDPLE